jgi:hypothetical protein
MRTVCTYFPSSSRIDQIISSWHRETATQSRRAAAFLARARDRPVAAGEDRRRGQGIRNVPDDPLLDLAPPPGQRVPRRRLDEVRSVDWRSLAATSCHCSTALDL